MKLVAIHAIHILDKDTNKEVVKKPLSVFEVDAAQGEELIKLGAATRVNSKRAKGLEILAEATREEAEGAGGEGDDDAGDEDETDAEKETKKVEPAKPSALQNTAKDTKAPVTTTSKNGRKLA